jgi:sugar-specific transcriptional regulator TrmB
MEWSELVESLARFGLADREAKLYLAALRRGRATARELTRDAGVDRVLGYRLLDAMRTRGLLEVTAERPRRYTPVAPADLLQRDLRGRRARLAEDEALASSLVEHLALLAGPSGDAPRYQLLVGSARVYDHLQEMIGRAQGSIDVMLTFRSLRASIQHGLQTQIAPFVGGGGQVRMLVESDPRLRPTLVRLRQATRRYRKAQIRERSPQPTRLTIVDRKEALVFLVPEAKDRHGDEVAVWTDHPSFVGGQQLFFDQMWSDPAPRPGRPPAPGAPGPPADAPS